LPPSLGTRRGQSQGDAHEGWRAPRPVGSGRSTAAQPLQGDGQPGNTGKKGAGRSFHWRESFGKTGHAIGIFLTLTPPTKPMVTEAAAMGQHDEPGFAPVPRLQIVTVEDAMKLRDRAVQLPARRDDTFKRAARDERGGRQGALDI